MFFAPVEATYVRLMPTTWRNDIAVRVALLGCPVTTTTPHGHQLHSTVQPTVVPRNYYYYYYYYVRSPSNVRIRTFKPSAPIRWAWNPVRCRTT